MTFKSKKVLQSALLIISLLYIYIFFKKYPEQINTVKNIGTSHICAIVAHQIVYLYIHSARSKIILTKYNPSAYQNIPFFDWLVIFAIGRLFNQFLPQTGNAYRSYFLKKHHQVSHSHFVSAFLAFAWMDLILNLSIALIAIAVLDPKLKIFHINGLLLNFILLSLFVSFPLLSLGMVSFLSLKTLKFSSFFSKSAELMRISLDNLRDFNFLLYFLFLSIGSAGISIFLYFFLFRQFGYHVEYGKLVLFYILFKLTTYFSLTPGNLGIRELAYGYLSAEVGANVATGIVISASLRAVHFFLLTFIGISMSLILFIRRRLSK